MTIAFSAKTADTDSTMSKTQTSSSFTSVTGRLYIVTALDVSADNNVDGGQVSVISTNNIQFTQVEYADIRDSGNGLWGTSATWIGVCTSGASGAVTVTWANSSDGKSMIVDEVSGANFTTPVRQVSLTTAAESTANAAATTTTTLSALSSSASTYAVSIFVQRSLTGTAPVGANVSYKTGYTALNSKVDTLYTSGLFSYYAVAGDTTPSSTIAATTDGSEWITKTVAQEVRAFLTPTPDAFGTAPAVGSLRTVGMGV